LLLTTIYFFQKENSNNNPSRQMDIQKVGKIPAGRVAIVACLLGSCTIIICYIIAVSLGHVPVWLPMISDCAVQAPEKYIFRIGMITAASCVFFTSVLFYFYIEYKVSRSVADKVALVLAGIASLGLATLAAVNEQEDNAVHSTAAVIFFFGYEVFMVISCIRLSQCSNTNRRSLFFKRLIAGVCAVLLGLFIHFSAHWGTYHIQIAMCEWSAVLLILLYNGSMCWEFKDEFAAEMIMSPSSSSLPSTVAGIPFYHPLGRDMYSPLPMVAEYYDN